jgi:tryptophan synthase alpha chain
VTLGIVREKNTCIWGRKVTAISDCFISKRDEGRSALIPYVTCGSPSLEESLDILGLLEDAGSDIIELGIPFSDPLADGPTIQSSSQLALENGVNVETVLRILSDFKRDSNIPVILFSYLNPILQYGLEEFLRGVQQAGAEGILLTDVPEGSDPSIEGMILESEVDFIRLVAPTTDYDRIAKISKNGQGFLYYISRTGVTGARDLLREELAKEIVAVKRVSEIPVAVGFGISTPDQAAMVGKVADGVVVGSALVKILKEEGMEAASCFIRSLREALDLGT